MLPGPRALSELLSTLYDAAADPALWDSFLQQLARTSHAQSAAIVMHQVGQDLHTISSAWQFDPEASRLYQQHFGPLDIWARRGRSKPSGYVCASDALCTDKELKPTEIYNDFMVPFEVEHGMFGLIENSQTRWASLSLYRGPSMPRFCVSDLEILRLLTPHMQRAFNLHFQFSELKAHMEGVATALDMLVTGVLLLGARGEILHMNRAARTIMARNDGLMATPRGLRAGCASESAQLEKLIREAVGTSGGKGLGAAGSLLISRNQGPSLQILISPARNLPVDLPRPPCAVAFVSDPEQRARPAYDVLRAFFGLTPAECRIALLIGDGKSPREIAQTLEVSSNTLKSHMANVYAKTDTSRQSQLVRLLMNLPMAASA